MSKAGIGAFAVPLDQLIERRPDILIVGSGPAGVAVAEYLFNVFPDVTIGILERGDILTMTHVNNVLPDQLRGEFINAHGAWPWKGYFENNGMMMFALGGRGIVAGGHLRRFDEVDFTLWDEGRWPIEPAELAPFFTVAELVRHVSPGECESPAQTWVMSVLDPFNPHPPPWGIDIRSTGAKRLLDSSAQRLCELVHRDALEAHAAQSERRVLLSTNTHVERIVVNHGRVRTLTCQNIGKQRELVTNGCSVVLAASPIESARLFMASRLPAQLDLKTAGKYLAEHILCRTEVTVPFPIAHAGEARVNVVIPPEAKRDERCRYQIDIRQSLSPVDSGKLRLRLSGFAAMDPSPKNRVELAGKDLNTVVEFSDRDRVRMDEMNKRIVDAATRLGVRARDIPPPTVAKGRSNHEVGTLRMGLSSNKESVTNRNGQVHGLENLFVADASVFPCVGVANPMLTITALSYRLAKHIGRQRKLKVRKDCQIPWSLC